MNFSELDLSTIYVTENNEYIVNNGTYALVPHAELAEDIEAYNRVAEYAEVNPSLVRRFVDSSTQNVEYITLEERIAALEDALAELSSGE